MHGDPSLPNSVASLTGRPFCGYSPEELRTMFERHGEVRDVYLPRDFYTDRPRGFGFVEFLDGRDAEDAMYHLDGVSYGGRDISVVMSKESRKTPSEMYSKDKYRGSGRRRYRSPGRRRSHSRSQSPHRRRYRSRSRSRGYSSRHYDRRSRSPVRNNKRYYRRSGSPPRHGRREESPYSDEKRYKSGKEEDRRHRDSRSPARDRSARRTNESRSPRSDDKRSAYSSSPRFRSRTRSPEDAKGEASNGAGEKRPADEHPEGENKSSLSPQSGRHDGDEMFHPTTSQVQDY